MTVSSSPPTDALNALPNVSAAVLQSGRMVAFGIA